MVCILYYFLSSFSAAKNSAWVDGCHLLIYIYWALLYILSQNRNYIQHNKNLFLPLRNLDFSKKAMWAYTVRHIDIHADMCVCHTMLIYTQRQSNLAKWILYCWVLIYNVLFNLHSNPMSHKISVSLNGELFLLKINIILIINVF